MDSAIAASPDLAPTSPAPTVRYRCRCQSGLDEEPLPLDTAPGSGPRATFPFLWIPWEEPVVSAAAAAAPGVVSERNLVTAPFFHRAVSSPQC